VLDEWNTPLSIARVIVRNLPNLTKTKIDFTSPDITFLEPSVGAGVFVQALIENGVEPSRIIGVDLVEELIQSVKDKYKIKAHLGDFLQSKISKRKSGKIVVLGNPPFSETEGLSFLSKAKEFANVICFILPLAYLSPARNRTPGDPKCECPVRESLMTVLPLRRFKFCFNDGTLTPMTPSRDCGVFIFDEGYGFRKVLLDYEFQNQIDRDEQRDKLSC
jgi:predicted RNA methylase